MALVAASRTLVPIAAERRTLSRPCRQKSAATRIAKLLLAVRRKNDVDPNLSYLEQTSVLTSTRRDYKDRAGRLVDWCREHRLDWRSPEELDQIVLLFFDECFWRGDPSAEGSKLLASLKFFIPAVSRLGSHHLPRSHRALKSWNKVDPGLQRLPLPRAVMLAICAWMLQQKLLWEAFAVVLSFVAYLRPGECQGLKVKNLVPPATLTGPYSRWSLDLHPASDGRPGKTGTFNETVLLDTDLWMYPLFSRLVANRSPESLLWPFSSRHLASRFHAACDRLRLRSLAPCLYSLRHGGASEDLLRRLRSPTEVMNRGRWRSNSSLKRYGKEAKLGAQLRLVPPQVIKLGESLEPVVGQMFAGTVRPNIPVLDV